MLSLTCKTAIKAVTYLASLPAPGTKAGIREIAAGIEASEHTVGKLLQVLVKEDIINSVKGPSGGFFVSKVQLKRPIILIVEAIDGKQVFRECALGLSKCSATHPCPLHGAYKEARDVMEALFRKWRIADLCDPVSAGIAHLAG